MEVRVVKWMKSKHFLIFTFFCVQEIVDAEANEVKAVEM